MTFYPVFVVLENQSDLAEGLSGGENEVFQTGGELRLGESFELTDDVFSSQTYRDGSEKTVGSDGVFVDIGGSRLRLGDIDEEVLGLSKGRREGLEDNFALVWVKPQRTDGMVGLQFKVREVTVGPEQAAGSVSVDVLCVLLSV